MALLEGTTNVQYDSSRSSSPVFHTARSSRSQISRKASFREIGLAFSSSDSSDLHSDIYNASYHPSSGTENLSRPSSPGDDASHYEAAVQSAPTKARPKSINGARYEYGLPLAPIPEHRSVATLRPTKSLDEENLASAQGLSQCGRQTRRTKSFSMNDAFRHHQNLPNASSSTRPSALSSSVSNGRDASPHQLYVNPNRPIAPPFERSSTPDGLPSWTAAQNRRPQPDRSFPSWRSWRAGLRDVFRRNQRDRFIYDASEAQYPCRAPRFCPPASGHGTPPSRSAYYRPETRSTPSTVTPQDAARPPEELESAASRLMDRHNVSTANHSRHRTSLDSSRRIYPRRSTEPLNRSTLHARAERLPLLVDGVTDRVADNDGNESELQTIVLRPEPRRAPLVEALLSFKKRLGRCCCGADGDGVDVDFPARISRGLVLDRESGVNTGC